MMAIIQASCVFQKLEFTLGTEEPRSPVGKGLSDECIQEELDRLIIDKAVDNSEVFDWVEVRIRKKQLVDWQENFNII